MNHDSAATGRCGGRRSGQRRRRCHDRQRQRDRRNCLSNNGQYGFNAYSLGRGDVSCSSQRDRRATTPTTGSTASQAVAAPAAASSGTSTAPRSPATTCTTTRVSGCGPTPTTRGFLFEGNYISDNDAEGIMYEISYNAAIRTTRSSATGSSRVRPTPASPRRRSTSPSRAATRGSTGTTASLVISGNVFTRQLVRGRRLGERRPVRRLPGQHAAPATRPWSTPVATAKTCATPNIVKRAVLQRLPVEDTESRGTKTTPSASVRRNLGSKCTAANGCGFNGLFSNYGTYPDWSPYKADRRREAHHVLAAQSMDPQQ